MTGWQRTDAVSGAPVVRLSRRWEIAAAHRLHAAELNEEQNHEVYGKCNNPHGHGHNYVIEVTVAGPVDEQTGMVTNLADLDSFAAREVVARFDHQNLNVLPEFEHRVPTTENFAACVEEIFRRYQYGVVERVHVEETMNNSFDVLSAAGMSAPKASRER